MQKPAEETLLFVLKLDAPIHSMKVSCGLNGCQRINQNVGFTSPFGVNTMKDSKQIANGRHFVNMDEFFTDIKMTLTT